MKIGTNKESALNEPRIGRATNCTRLFVLDFCFQMRRPSQSESAEPVQNPSFTQVTTVAASTGALIAQQRNTQIDTAFLLAQKWDAILVKVQKKTVRKENKIVFRPRGLF